MARRKERRLKKQLVRLNTQVKERTPARYGNYEAVGKARPRTAANALRDKASKGQRERRHNKYHHNSQAKPIIARNRKIRHELSVTGGVGHQRKIPGYRGGPTGAKYYLKHKKEGGKWKAAGTGSNPHTSYHYNKGKSKTARNVAIGVGAAAAGIGGYKAYKHFQGRKHGERDYSRPGTKRTSKMRRTR